MKLGVCTGVENSALLNETGYEYIEMGLSGIAAMKDEDYDTLLKAVKEAPLKSYAFNVLLPGTIKVTGEEVDMNLITNYLEKAFSRASQLGGKIVVFGSGGARRVPENFSHERAFKQLVEFLNNAGPIAEKYGITIVIEPLRSAETNIINTASEGLKLAKAVNHPNVRLLVDFYHMACENESPDILLEAGCEYIKHLHIANPEGRVWPKDTAEADYKPFFDNLKTIGYEGSLSIEGKTEDIVKDSPISFNCLKELTK